MESMNFWSLPIHPMDGDGFKYWVALTAFDRGVPEEGVPSMESGIRATKVLAIPGTTPADGPTEVSVVPNPYRGQAIWDGDRDREKYVWFINLPMRATIRSSTTFRGPISRPAWSGPWPFREAYAPGILSPMRTRLSPPGFTCTRSRTLKAETTTWAK